MIQNFFTKVFVDITHTHTSNVLAFGGTGSTTRRVSFSVWIACKLHADPMIPQKPPKSTFPVKTFRQFFYFLISANPTISPSFMVIGHFLFFGLFGIAPPSNMQITLTNYWDHVTTIEKLRNSPEINEMTVKPQLNSRKWPKMPISDEKLKFTWNSWLRFQVNSRSAFWMDYVTSPSQFLAWRDAHIRRIPGKDQFDANHHDIHS